MSDVSPKERTRKKRRLTPAKRLLKFAGRTAFRVLPGLSRFLRPWSVNAFGSALGWMFYRVSRRHRKVTLKNLRAVYGGEKSEAEIESMARAVFRHFARGALEFFYLLSRPPGTVDGLVEMHGLEHLDNALAGGAGCVVVTAHYGNWEVMVRRAVRLGYPVNVIARDSDDPGMTGIGTRMRESGGYKVFDRSQPVIGAFRCLKRNEILGILPDQNDMDGIFVDFFGRPAATATGPAVLALRSGAPVLTAFASRKADGTYTTQINPPIEIPRTGNDENDIHELMTRINREIERAIRAEPTQWLWLHDRWKLSPEAPSR